MTNTCNAATAPDTSANREVRIGLWTPITILDPVYSTTFEQITLFEATFEGLLKISGNKLIAAEAKSWSVSEDGKQYVFILRDDIFWSDGVAVTARDYVQAFQRMVDKSNNLASRPDYLLSALRNATAIREGVAQPASLGVSAPNDKTLIFDLDAPASYFPNILAYSGLVPVPAHMIAKHGNDWWKQQPLVTNGPYLLASGESDQDWLLTIRNKAQYPDAPQQVRLVTVKNIDDALRRVINNDIDIAYSIRQSDMGWIKNRIGYQLYTAMTAETVYVIFNTSLPKLADPRVRRALSLAIDRKALAEATQSRVANSFVVPWMLEGAETDLEDKTAKLGQKERLDLARKLLAELGYSEKKPLELIIMSPPLQSLKSSALALRSMFASVGVKASMEIVPQEEFSSHLNQKKHEVSVGDWFADYDDGMTYYSILQTRTSKNHSAFSNPEFDRLSKQAQSEADIIKRRKIYVQLEKILRDEAPIVPLIHSTYKVIASPRIKELGFASFLFIAAYNIRLN